MRRVRHSAGKPAPTPFRYDAERIREVRVRLGFNQNTFAQALNVSGQTVRAWEQGVNAPSGAALRLLEVAERHPEVLRAAGD